jgi:glycosyltransferase involved in cell wall biosynthesis
VRVLSPDGISPRSAQAAGVPVIGSAGTVGPSAAEEDLGLQSHGFRNTTFRGVPATFASPYPGHELANKATLVDVGEVTLPSPAQPSNAASEAYARHVTELLSTTRTGGAMAAAPNGLSSGPANGNYGFDLVGDAERYARLVVSLTRGEEYDVIHAHDWLTFPAGVMLSRVSGKPLVAHVHSTEFDRAGNNVNQRVFEIERMGMQSAHRVIAVSQLTKSICERRYGVPADRIDVVYNGIEREGQQPSREAAIQKTDKIVLFLGRITMQKGPEYFIAAAKRVLEKVPNTKFVIAGSGDMALRMVELATNMGIGHKVVFTGFLQSKDVERVFGLADCYVMPSVSEPFGLAALEALSHDVPVIVSKTSGVSEVLSHVLKVDFWDIDEMANKIVAVLRHPPLSSTLREHGAFELQRLTWTGAAEKCVVAYQNAIGQHDAAGELLPA